MFFYLSVNGPFFGVGVISGSSRGHLGVISGAQGNQFLFFLRRFFLINSRFTSIFASAIAFPVAL
jgi:hypothetical protein